MGVDSNALHLRTSDQARVLRAYASWLRRQGYRSKREGAIPHFRETGPDPVFRRVLVSPPEGGWITVVDQAYDEQSLGAMRRTCQHLSQVLSCVGLACIVHDSQALYYYLCDRGVLLDCYCSWPGWYSRRAPSRVLRRRWKASPERLLPACRPDVTLEHLQAIVRDYSRPAPSGELPPWPETVLERLAECLGIVDPLRTYAAYHASPPSVSLLLPGGDDAPPTRLLIPTGPIRGASWDGFVHRSFMKVL